MILGLPDAMFLWISIMIRLSSTNFKVLCSFRSWINFCCKHFLWHSGYCISDKISRNGMFWSQRRGIRYKQSSKYQANIQNNYINVDTNWEQVVSIAQDYYQYLLGIELLSSSKCIDILAIEMTHSKIYSTLMNKSFPCAFWVYSKATFKVTFIIWLGIRVHIYEVVLYIYLNSFCT